MAFIIFDKMNRDVLVSHLPKLIPHKMLISLDGIKVQADGDELDFIRARFDNLPVAKGNICIWRGEMAIFIVTNLVN